MFTVEKITKRPEFSYLSLLNSNADLKREISTIEITETPDVAEYLPKNTFLLTTGMAFREDPAGFRQFIHSLDNLPIAGIGIKLGRYIDALDQSILDYADELQFPLFSISEEQTLGNVSHHMLSYLWDNQSGAMESALNLQRQFSEMMLRGASVENLIKYLGSALKIPIVLEDPFFNVVAVSHHFHNDSSLEKSFDQVQEPFLKELLIDYSKTKKRKSLENSRYRIFPIKLDSAFNYFLILMKNEEEMFPFSSLMIEQASIILAHTIYKNLKVVEKNIQSRKRFFKHFINSDQSTAKHSINWTEYNEDFGLIKSDYYQAILCEFRLLDTNKTQSDPENIQFNLLYNWIEKELSRYTDEIILFPANLENGFGMLVQSEHIGLETIARNLRDQLRTAGVFTLHFYVGSPVFSPHSIYFSYKEAYEMFANMEKFQEEKPLMTHYKIKDTQGLINYIPDHVRRHFCITNLGELAYPTEDSVKDLRHTLKVFLDSQSEIKLTSERLFVHRNTVKYRIAKCKDILGTSLDDPQNTLNLRMALEMSEQTVS